MSKKIQVWLRPDQAACAMQALSYAAAACQSVADDGQYQNSRILAGTLARDRINDVISILDDAMVRVQL